MFARLGFVAAALAAFGQIGWAEGVPVETATLGASTITLYLHSFLSPEELAMLRLVAVNEQALSVFIPSGAGYAALAVSPEDGFIRDGALVVSAVALAGLPDQATAASEALAACNTAKTGAPECVTVLAIAPVP